MATFLEILGKIVFWLVIIVLGLVTCFYVSCDLVPKYKYATRPEILRYDQGPDGDTFQKRIDAAFPSETPVKEVVKKLSDWGFKIQTDRSAAEYRLEGFLHVSTWTITWEIGSNGLAQNIKGHYSSASP